MAIDPDFFQCGHTKTPDNFQKAGWNEKGKKQYRCRQCANLRGRKRYTKTGRKFKPNFPCGHPRIEENKEHYLWRVRKNGVLRVFKLYRCLTCRKQYSSTYRRKVRRIQKSSWVKKPKATFVRGSIIVSSCYESDVQCHWCGYMLRYTRTGRCVACERIRSNSTNAKRRLVAANKADTRASNIHRGGKSELTHMAQMRQDVPP